MKNEKDANEIVEKLLHDVEKVIHDFHEEFEDLDLLLMSLTVLSSHIDAKYRLLSEAMLTESVRMELQKIKELDTSASYEEYKKDMNFAGLIKIIMGI